MLSLVPKRNSKYLIQGKAWVDSAEFGLVRIEGYPTESLSFWVGKPFIVQEFDNVGGHWLLRSNKSIVDAKIIGRIELTVSSKTYAMGTAALAEAAESRPLTTPNKQIAAQVSN